MEPANSLLGKRRGEDGPSAAPSGEGAPPPAKRARPDDQLADAIARAKAAAAAAAAAATASSLTAATAAAAARAAQLISTQRVAGAQQPVPGAGNPSAGLLSNKLDEKRRSSGFIDAATAASLMQSTTGRLPAPTDSSKRFTAAASTKAIPLEAFKSQKQQNSIVEAAKTNPYLAHFLPSASRSSGPSRSKTTGTSNGDLEQAANEAASLPGEAEAKDIARGAPKPLKAESESPGDVPRFDPSRRLLLRQQKGLNFVEEGALSRRADEVRARDAHRASIQQQGHLMLNSEPQEFDGSFPTADAASDAAAAQSTTTTVPPKMRVIPVAPSGIIFPSVNAALHAYRPALAVGAHGAGGIVLSSEKGEGSHQPSSFDASVPFPAQPTLIEWWDAAFLPISLTKEFASAVAQSLPPSVLPLQLVGHAARDRSSSLLVSHPLLRRCKRLIEAIDDRLIGKAAGPTDAPLDSSDAGEIASASWFGYYQQGSAAIADEVPLVSLSHSKTHTLVQHPVPIVTEADKLALAPKPLPLMLTEKERKKQRRLTRAARFQEIQDQIRIGLLPAPEPKVRLSNLMRVLKDAAVADPSALEAKIRSQVARRIENHEMRNLAKKLTPQERRDKWKRKMTAHGPHGPAAALFRISNLTHGKNRYKVDTLARQLFLGGMVVECPSASCWLVYVEGGTRAVAKFIRALSRRVKWQLVGKPPTSAAANATEAKGGAAQSEDESDASEVSSDDDSDEDSEDEGDGIGAPAGLGHGSGNDPAAAWTTTEGTGDAGSLFELVWKGSVPRHHFLARLSSSATLSPAVPPHGADVGDPVFSWKLAHSPSQARACMEGSPMQTTLLAPSPSGLALGYMWDAVFASHVQHQKALAQAGNDDGDKMK